ncbi:hypothetical protein GGX14DRAFT_343181, partial [Mycena pura]
RIAIELHMPLRVVQRVIKTWKEIGEVCRDRRYKGRHPILSPEHIEARHTQAVSVVLKRSQFLFALLDHSPDLYLDELQEALLSQHDLDVSLATISRTLHRLGMSRKKLSRVAAERCADARREFTLEIGGEPAERLVCADESAVNILTTYRQYG